MKIEGQVTIERGKAVLRSGEKRVILVPYPRDTELPQSHKESMGVALFAYLHGRKERLKGDLEDGFLFNARVENTPRRIKDVALNPESTDGFHSEIEKYFKRDASIVARNLNFIEIRSVSALYHRLKRDRVEPPAMARYLGITQTSLNRFVKAIETDSSNDVVKRGLISAPIQVPFAGGVNVARLLKERGVRVTRKAKTKPPAFPESEATPELPSAVDLRAHMTGIRYQGGRGTCVAHTAAAMLEYELVRAKQAKRSIDLAEQYLYWACKNVDGAPNEEGTLIRYAGQILQFGVPAQKLTAGACRERFWRYSSSIIPGNEAHAPLPAKARNAERYAVQGFKMVQHNSIGDLKSALAENHCVGLSVFTYHFWTDGFVWREGAISLPVGIESDGAHAICLVGYQDADNTHRDGHFIFKNSWSESWGAARKDPGYGSLPYRYVINEAIEAWFIEL
jgi:C1A family cysteine protease